MHPLMVLIHPLLVLIRGIEGGALASTTGAKAWIGGAHRVEYSYYRDIEEKFLTKKEVCFRLGITDRTLRNYVRAGRITPDVIFKNMFSEKEVSRFEKERIKSLKLVEPFPDRKRGT